MVSDDSGLSGEEILEQVRQDAEEAGFRETEEWSDEFQDSPVSNEHGNMGSRGNLVIVSSNRS